MRVGFVGLGQMGSPMATRLEHAGVDVEVCDQSPCASEPFSARGVPVASTAGQLARDSDVVILMLPDSRVVEAVIEGSNGLLENLDDGNLVIDMSSSESSSTRRLHPLLASRGIGLVDAPVSRGIPAAERGGLSIFAGGLDADVERSLPILRHFGTDILRMGGPGTGHAAKALNNLLNATTVLSTCEVVVAAHVAGVDVDAFVAAVNASSGRSYATEVKLPQHILSGTFDSGFTVGLMAKDVAMALALLNEGGVSAAVSTAVGTGWTDALARLGPATDHTRVHELIENAAGSALATATREESQ